MSLDSLNMKETKRRSFWSSGWARFRRNPMGMAGAVIVVSLYLIALFAPMIAPGDPVNHGDLPSMRHLPPGGSHLLGTDKFGRDVFTRLLYGSRISLVIGFIAVTISVLIGTIVGAVAGYAGGIVDSVIMRIVDALMAIPRLFLLLTCIALFSRSIWLIIFLLGATSWMATVRLVRAQLLTIKEQDFVVAAEALAEAALSFLGLGGPPPTPSWGQMVFEGREVLLGAWWVSTFPGLAIIITVIGYNLLGDGLRDAFDPVQFS